MTSTPGTINRSVRVISIILGNTNPLPIFGAGRLPPALPGFIPPNLLETLTPFWSVSVEEWFYVLWPPVILLCGRRSIIAVACFILAMTFLYRWLSFTDWEWCINVCCRMDQLTIGGMLALWLEQAPFLSDKAHRRGNRALTCAAIVAVFLVSLILFTARPIIGHDIRGSVLFAAFGPPLIGLAVAGFIASILRAPGSAIIPRLLRCAPMTYIGRRSYMTYLIHMPIYFAISLTGLGSWPVAILSTWGSLSVAALSWAFFESPLLALRDRKRERVSRISTESPYPAIL